MTINMTTHFQPGTTIIRIWKASVQRKYRLKQVLRAGARDAERPRLYIERGLSMNTSVRTRKRVNCAWLGQSPGKTLMMRAAPPVHPPVVFQVLLGTSPRRCGRSATPQGGREQRG